MNLAVVLGEEIAQYGFPNGHPFGPDRHEHFVREFTHRKLDEKCLIQKPILAHEEELLLFHQEGYIELVKKLSQKGYGFLDYGDTPAFPGCYESAAFVAGSALALAKDILSGKIYHGFLPIGGLHHARRERAGGFCIFNDCGIVIEYLFKQGFEKVAYVDIDAHHGDGVFYAFEEDARLIFADIHQGGIYPGTGDFEEQGKGKAFGKKLNIPLSWGATDQEFFEAWDKVLEFLEKEKPEFILLQCGADSLNGDPLTGLAYSENAHRIATRNLVELAQKYAENRLLAFGGGGYNRKNLAMAWNAVVEELL